MGWLLNLHTRKALAFQSQSFEHYMGNEELVNELQLDEPGIKPATSESLLDAKPLSQTTALVHRSKWDLELLNQDLVK